MNVLRRIEGVCWKDRITNDEKLGQVGVMEKVKKRQEAWKETLEGMGNERCTKRVFEDVVDGNRPRGSNIRAEAARLRRASTAMVPRKKRNTHDGIPMMALPQ